MLSDSAENPRLEPGRDGGGKLSFSKAVDRVISVEPVFAGVSEIDDAGVGALERALPDEAVLDLAVELDVACANGSRVWEKVRLTFTAGLDIEPLLDATSFVAGDDVEMSYNILSSR